MPTEASTGAPGAATGASAGEALHHLYRLQRQLERTYEVAVPHQVDEFLITDAEALPVSWKALARGVSAPADLRSPQDVEEGPPEALIVIEHDGELTLGLYVDGEIVSRLAEDDPLARLHGGNLEDFCIALEGVSHFLYLAWNATHDRPVSRLELELQAEVDKYVCAAFLLASQAGGRVPRGLAGRLFEQASLRPELTPEAAERYRRASEYAARYCAELEGRFMRGGGAGGMLKELRRFYRLRHRDKLARIERGA